MQLGQCEKQKSPLDLIGLGLFVPPLASIYVDAQNRCELEPGEAGEGLTSCPLAQAPETMVSGRAIPTSSGVEEARQPPDSNLNFA